jgi:hypothetical protein
MSAYFVFLEEVLEPNPSSKLEALDEITLGDPATLCGISVIEYVVYSIL